jgi:methionyl-tRNA formyltransferase
VLDRHLPALIAGTAPRVPQNLATGSYFGGRRPDDGRIDWRMSAAQIHNLVRGVAPPYPGAFTAIDGKTLRILGTRLDNATTTGARAPQLFAERDACYAACADGATLRIVSMELDGNPLTAADFLAHFGNQPINLEIAPQ